MLQITQLTPNVTNAVGRAQGAGERPLVAGPPLLVGKPAYDLQELE